MKNRIKTYFCNKKGMSLVEVLTAMALISLVIFCFTPLFLTYFKSITITGQKIDDVNVQSGTLQTVIGLADTSESDRYSTAIGEVPLSLIVKEPTRVSRKGEVADNYVPAGESATLGTELSSFKGDLLFSNPTDPNNSFITANGAGTASGISYYPSSITDDFYTAAITLVADGGAKFKEDLAYSDFVVTVADMTAAGGVATLDADDYTIKRYDEEIVVLSFYGGGKVCFENSPLTIKYGSYTCVIEVDAPSMIMVGEADSAGEYHYYVSRGEVDTQGNLVLIQRRMNSKDALTGKTTTLTSAMNDVEWVPAESGDGHNVDSNGKKYGYYVMCGDEGQVRRFWKNNATGNYYWGGDYTYYTDYNFNRFNTPTYINYEIPASAITDSSGRVYSTDTSFKFISQRDMTNSQSGFNLASKEYTLIAGVINTSTGLLRGLSVVSATYSNDAEFYGPDGMLFYYQLKKDGSSTYPTFSQSNSFGSSWQGLDVLRDLTLPTNIAYSWLQTKANSYYDFYGVDATNKASYPITLTSVDAIQISGTGAAHKTNVKASSEGSYYFTSSGDGDTTAEGATTNMNYPQSSYTLYCGYIPAMMDMWAENTGNGSYRYPTGFKEVYAKTSDGTWYAVSNPNITRASNRTTVNESQSYYTKWRMTLGVTPYFTTGTSGYQIGETGTLAYYKKNSTSWIGGWKYPYEYLMYYPCTNLNFAITGKFYDVETFNERRDEINEQFGNAYNLASPEFLINNYDNTQQNITNNEIVDVTVSYLSHPFAIAVAANPTDDIVYDYGNVKKDEDGYGQVFYWNNRRETITFIDAASTIVPSSTKPEEDIPVSLMVGYLLGGTVEFSKDGGDMYANVGSVMNNGIVFLRSGNYRVEKQNSDNGQTYEYLAIDSDGYQLGAESNVFHQFYYLNSRGAQSSNPSKGKHIGDLYGADYWQTNRHIQYKSLYGRPACDELASDGSNKYEYLRSHPMTNTKVTCVAWGTTWNKCPEAMWGTENGTVLSWWINPNAENLTSSSTSWNDRSVDAEFQSYKWVDNVNGKTFPTDSTEYLGTIGSATPNSKSNVGSSYTLGSGHVPANFQYFCDKTSQATGLYGTIGFISTLETINDIAFANDTWVAVGNQSDVDPDMYCSNGIYEGGGEPAKAYSNHGSGSWVNVRYWVDTKGDGIQTEENSYYHWRAVRISSNPNYNIVQINCLNGMWVASGYIDANNNDQFDNGERNVFCWTYNPLIPNGEEGGWNEGVNVFKFVEGQGMVKLDVATMGGINSCATRSEE